MALEIVGALVDPVVNYVMKPIGRQFGYLLCFRSNIENLLNEAAYLDDVRSAIRLLVEDAENNVRIIGPDVDSWLRRADENRDAVNAVLENARNAKKGCFNLWSPDIKSRYVLGRKVKKIADATLALRNEGNGFERRTSYPAPLGGIYPAPLRRIFSILEVNFEALESRLETQRNITNALEETEVHIIGICGLGGVGKTTIVKVVAREVEERKLFSKIIISVVSQQPDLKKIQREIAEQLSLTLQEETESVRAARLRERIMAMNTVLIILDDTWVPLNLQAIGIPLPTEHKECKVIVTSRNQHVCDQMSADKIFPIHSLSEEEAWSLFRRIAGSCIDDRLLNPIARDVANECGGLPLALVTVGSALKDKTNEYIWEDACNQMRKAVPEHIQNIMPEVYRSLQLSFNQLESEAKSLLFHCCLFPEDSNIPLEGLVGHSVGLQMFRSTDTIQEARVRVYALVDKLRSSFLLQDGDEYKCVKMHDVVRDVALSMGSDTFMVSHDVTLSRWPRRDSYEHYTCLSVRCESINHLPLGINFPSVEFLLLQCSTYPRLEVPDNLWDGLRMLKLLDVHDMEITSKALPSQFLTNLRVLHLHWCSVGNISAVGSLVNLEVLSIRFSLMIDVLPADLGQLTNLRMLELRHCSELQTIPPGVISSLIHLEELYMINSFRSWEDGGVARQNAAITELESLPNLTTLQIEIENLEVLSRDVHLGPKLKRYFISTGDRDVEEKYHKP